MITKYHGQKSMNLQQPQLFFAFISIGSMLRLLDVHSCCIWNDPDAFLAFKPGMFNQQAGLLQFSEQVLVLDKQNHGNVNFLKVIAAGSNIVGWLVYFPDRFLLCEENEHDESPEREAA